MIVCMKKRKDTKKLAKKNEKSEDSKANIKKKQNEVDLWKEIRTNIKPLVKAYNKFSEKRKIAKQREEDRKFKEDEKQKFREEEALKLQEEKERKLERQKKAKEEKERRLKDQEDQRLEEKRIKDERAELIRQEQIYRERLLKGEQERIKQFNAVKESREVERQLRNERNLDIKSKIVEKQNPEDKEQRLKDEEQRLNEKEQRLKEKEEKLKEEEIRLKNDNKINLKAETELDTDDSKKKKLSGTVLWFNENKGYGFIERDDKEKNLFVHFSALQNSGLSYLKKGEKLMFEVEHSDKGVSAVNLHKIVNEESHSHLMLIK